MHQKKTDSLPTAIFLDLKIRHVNDLFQTENGLYLLVTFHNLSAPYTVDCEGAYIEVERENNGFEARWCGNRVTKVFTLLLFFAERGYSRPI